jgi:TrmH family RNA methyltransferase
MKPITSEQNPNFKRWLTLLESKGIKKEGQCLVSGRKVFPEMMAQFSPQMEEILVFSEDQIDEWQIPTSRNIYVLPKLLFQQLDTFSTHAPLAVMKTPDISDWTENQKPQGLEVLVALQDPSNLGSFLRSAEAFGVSKVILLRESAHPFHPKVSKTASVSNWRVKLEKGPSIQDVSGRDDLWVLDKSGASLLTVNTPSDLRFLIGEEGQGVPIELLRQSRTISIPIQAEVESLNAVVAGSIALFWIKNGHPVPLSDSPSLAPHD